VVSAPAGLKAVLPGADGPKVLDLEDFARHRHERFRVALENAEVDVELIEASDLGPAAVVARRRRTFSLVFRGPREPVLPQRIHGLKHAALGELEIFLVPIGPDRVGMRYEAIFN
jgi:hypothetical protein